MHLANADSLTLFILLLFNLNNCLIIYLDITKEQCEVQMEGQLWLDLITQASHVSRSRGKSVWVEIIIVFM